MARILVVDDDETSRDLVRNYLAYGEEEHEVVMAADAFQAMEILDKYRVDLALIDINMPHTNGYQLVNSFKKSIRFKFLPVVFFSSRNTPVDIKRASELGVDGYIIKPIQREAFLVKIKELLRLKPARQQLKVDVDDENAALIKVHYNVKLESVTELGMVVISDRKIAVDDDRVDIVTPFFSQVGIDPIPLKVIAVKDVVKETAAEKASDKQFYRIALMFEEVKPEAMQKIKNWLLAQNRIK